MNRAADFGITLEDVAITHLSFGTEVGLLRHGAPHQGGIVMFTSRHQTSHTYSCSPPGNLQFTKAVEQKQVAEQDAERAKFVVMLAEQV